MADSDRDQRVFKKVRKIVADHLGVKEEEITRETGFVDDLNADSLDLVELIMEFEEEFGGEIPDEEAEKIATVGNAVNWILENTKDSK